MARKNLFTLSVEARQNGKPRDPAWMHTPMPLMNPAELTVMGKPVGSDGKLYFVLPDNQQMDVTVKANGADHYNAWVGAQKHVAYITANGVRLDAKEIKATNCVGQKIVFALEFDPAAPGGVADNKHQWLLSGKYVNGWEEWVGNGYTGYRAYMCHPETNWWSQNGAFGVTPEPPYCKLYQTFDWPLTQPETGAWWVSGGKSQRAAMTFPPTIRPG